MKSITKTTAIFVMSVMLSSNLYAKDTSRDLSFIKNTRRNTEIISFLNKKFEEWGEVEGVRFNSNYTFQNVSYDGCQFTLSNKMVIRANLQEISANLPIKINDLEKVERKSRHGGVKLISKTGRKIQVNVRADGKNRSDTTSHYIVNTNKGSPQDVVLAVFLKLIEKCQGKDINYWAHFQQKGEPDKESPIDQLANSMRDKQIDKINSLIRGKIEMVDQCKILIKSSIGFTMKVSLTYIDFSEQSIKDGRLKLHTKGFKKVVEHGNAFGKRKVNVIVFKTDKGREVMFALEQLATLQMCQKPKFKF